MYDEVEHKKGCVDVKSKIFIVTSLQSSKLYAYVYINFSNDYIQIDGSEEISYKMILLRGLRMEEINNKYYLYNYVCALQYFKLLICE